MARLAGVDLPRQKQVRFGLTYIYGIGPSLSKKILEATKIDPTTKVNDLTEGDVAALKQVLSTFTVEGDLRRQEGLNIKRLIEISSYRGSRHRRGLPCRGQKTKTNARTRRGRRGGPMKKRA